MSTLLNVATVVGLVVLGHQVWCMVGYCDYSGVPHPYWDCCKNWRRFGRKR